MHIPAAGWMGVGQGLGIGQGPHLALRAVWGH